MTSAAVTGPEVLILGGDANAISLIRSLSEHGIKVRLSSSEGCLAVYSRHCFQNHPIPPGVKAKDHWAQLLLQGDSTLRGCVLFPCNDDGIVFLCENRAALEKHYLLDDFQSDLHLALLDKQRTLDMARALDIPTPRYWNVETRTDIENALAEIDYPVILKPIHSHIFQREYQGRKYLRADNQDELLRHADDVLGRGIQVMASELIPGPDDLACSYFTYRTGDRQPLFHYTKRCIRRHPYNSGLGTYQITEWIPEVAALGQRFFDCIDFTGLAHIEFKRDLRDGRLKVIEVNPRFSAAQECIVKSGVDMAYIIYCHLTGRNGPIVKGYKDHVRLINLFSDYRAYKQLRQMGKMTFGEWLKSLAHPQTFTYLRLSDPLPGVVGFLRTITGKLRSVFVS
jgi:D-aspartate ligase